jgi:hypothetical protein
VRDSSYPRPGSLGRRILSIFANWFGRKRGASASGRELSFGSPLVLLQSDDWGRVGVRDKEGYEQLRASGIRLGENPYDFYTLETAEDVMALRDVLKRHRDYAGRAACLVMNFLMSNLNFPKMAAGNYQQLELLSLTEGLPGNWKRPGLFEAYRQGIADGVFYPALHGLTHFCSTASDHALAKSGERSDLLRTLWKAETPYIYWRMPWIGYEYLNPEKPQAGFLSVEKQEKLIQQAANIFETLFLKKPVSACAPGYRSNHDTHLAWSRCGVKVAQNGSGSPLAPHMDEYEILNLHRTIDIEPTQRDLPIEKYVQLAESCFARGIPAIVSVHAINFHSSLKDFRTTTLQTLDQFLSALEKKHPDLLYVHDADVYDIVMRGKLRTSYSPIPVTVKVREK